MQGDINPHNVLFDDKDQLKLIDFNHSLKVGEDLDVGYELYVRSRKRDKAAGIMASLDLITEQLAFGSFFGL